MMEGIEINGFTFEDIITIEERSIMYGVARGVEFDKVMNKQLNLARVNKHKVGNNNG